MKKTVVIGASPDPTRYSNLASLRLLEQGHNIVPLGIKKGTIGGISILNDKPELQDVDTVTLYLNPARQKEWYDYILSLKPKRIIFNPGTENAEFELLAAENNIETAEACTLVLLSTNQY